MYTWKVVEKKKLNNRLKGLYKKKTISNLVKNFIYN